MKFTKEQTDKMASDLLIGTVGVKDFPSLVDHPELRTQLLESISKTLAGFNYETKIDKICRELDEWLKSQIFGAPVGSLNYEFKLSFDRFSSVKDDQSAPKTIVCRIPLNILGCTIVELNTFYEKCRTLETAHMCLCEPHVELERTSVVFWALVND